MERLLDKNFLARSMDSKRMTNRQILDAQITEADFIQNILNLAHLKGWKSAHFRPAMTKQGWRTAVQGDGAGFPDLVLVHPEQKRLIFVEVKREGGVRSQNQFDWAQWLVQARAKVHCWQPSDWDEIVEILSPKQSIIAECWEEAICPDCEQTLNCPVKLFP